MSSRISTPASRSCLAEAKVFLDLRGVGRAVLQVELQLRQALLTLFEPFAALGLQLLVRVDLVLPALHLRAKVIEGGAGEIDLREACGTRLELLLDCFQPDLAQVELAGASGDGIGTRRVSLQPRLGCQDGRLAAHDSGFSRFELREERKGLLGGLTMALAFPLEPLFLGSQALFPGAHRDVGVRGGMDQLVGLALQLRLDGLEQLCALGDAGILRGERLLPRLDLGKRAGGLRFELANRAFPLDEQVVALAHGMLTGGELCAGRLLGGFEGDAFALQLALALADGGELLRDLPGGPCAFTFCLLELLDASVDVRAEFRHARVFGDDLRVPLDELQPFPFELPDAGDERLLALIELGRSLFEVRLKLRLRTGLLSRLRA